MSNTTPTLSRFRSNHPPLRLPRQSLYTYLLEQDIYKPERTFTIHVISGEVVSRGQVKELSLRLAYGLRNLGRIGLQELHRGGTAAIVSPSTNLYVPLMLALVSTCLGLTCPGGVQLA